MSSNNNINVYGMIEKLNDKYDLEIYLIKDFVVASEFEDEKIVEVLSGEYCSSLLPMIDNNKVDRNVCVFKMDYEIDDSSKVSYNNLLNRFREEFVGSYLACNYVDGHLNDMFFVQHLENELNEEQVEEEFNNKQNVVFGGDGLKLKEISKKIKEAVINQDTVVDKTLANIVFNQKLYYSNLSMEKARILKKNMLIFGKTGTGKTEIIRQVVSNLDYEIPFVIEDANSYTIDGYKGKDVVDMLRRLVIEAEYDIEAAEHGILVIDEIDKKLQHSDVSEIASTGVQQALLKIIEGGVFDLSSDKMPEFSGVELDTSLITVILLGHFDGLYKDSKKNVIGFGTSDFTDEENNKYKPEDFVKMGMIPEFMGRISDIVKTNDLDIDTIKKIISDSTISPLVLEREFYEEELGIKLSYDDEFINALAEKTMTMGTGARGIKSSYEEMMDVDNLSFELLSGEVKEVKFEKGKVRKLGVRKEKSYEKEN